jgi:hypothetical protein
MPGTLILIVLPADTFPLLKNPLKKIVDILELEVQGGLIDVVLEVIEQPLLAVAPASEIAIPEGKSTHIIPP